MAHNRLFRNPWIGLTAMLLWAATSGWAAPPEKWLPDAQAQDILAKIKAREATIKTAVAEFTQEQLTPMFTEPITTRGRAHVDAGGRMRIDLLGAAPMVMLIDGVWLYLHFPDMDKTTRRRVGFAKNTLTTTFGYGLPVSELTRRFDVKVAATADNTGYRLLMTPRQAMIAARIAAIAIRVPRRTWLPREVVLTLPDKATITIRITALTINEPLPPEIFSTAGWVIEDDSTPGHAAQQAGAP